MQKSVYTRIFFIRTVIVFIITLLIARLYTIMITDGKQIKKSAEKQNSLTVSVSDRRNDILDRNMKGLTGVEKADYAVIFSTNDTKKDFALCKFLSKYSDENEYKIYSRLQLNKRTFTRIKSGNGEIFEKYPNFSVLSVANRYLHDYPCAALLGYVSDGKGISGLEKVYNKFLTSAEGYKVSARSDALMRLVPGAGKTVAGINVKSRKLKTTLDLDFCRIAEKVLKENDVKAGVVVLDINSFDLLAMATNPSFDPNNVGDYLNSEDGNLVNRCLNSYDMGSIFKIVVASAAIEEGIVSPTDIFDCKGYCYIGDQKIDCHNVFGHGKITFEEAFMYSCNPVFIDVGIKLGYDKILKYARKFGMGSKILNPMSLNQSLGTLPDNENYYLADVANISIGQGSLTGNCINGAVFSAVIAAGGIIKPVNSTDCITDSAGQKVKELRIGGEDRIISAQTAKTIYKMMIKTNIDGTGTGGYIENFGSGGKTGSAQTGWIVDGKYYQHGWYTGFFPADKPQFAICIFVENGQSGAESAAPIFREIGEQILSKVD